MTTYKSKTLTTWLATWGGSLGLHRFYLYGWRDGLAWLWLTVTSIGVYGFYRARVCGQDDQLSWVLLVPLGLSVSAAALMGLIHGLMTDERWNARFNPQGRAHVSNGLTVLGAITALFLGATALVSTIALSGQRYFEYQTLQVEPQTSRPFNVLMCHAD
jgi:hypothetical protein